MLCPPWFPSEANPGTILGQAFGQRCDARGENAISLDFLEVGSTTGDMAPVDLGMGQDPRNVVNTLRNLFFIDVHSPKIWYICFYHLDRF